ncbi:MAG TPA: hypothetical protein VN598_02420 [Usitatibacter sp.]|nr:hypothetical protein [Usitatibacter sp.]
MTMLGMGAIIGIVVVFSIVGYLTGWGIPTPYRTRPCQAAAWRREYPAASNEQIREFLSLLVRALGFRDRFKLNFAPTDRFMDLYRALYPRKNMPDGLEFEHFADLVTKRYNFNLAGAWTDELTLGQVFAMVVRNDA